MDENNYEEELEALKRKYNTSDFNHGRASFNYAKLVAYKILKELFEAAKTNLNVLDEDMVTNMSKYEDIYANLKENGEVYGDSHKSIVYQPVIAYHGYSTKATGMIDNSNGIDGEGKIGVYIPEAFNDLSNCIYDVLGIEMERFGLGYRMDRHEIRLSGLSLDFDEEIRKTSIEAYLDNFSAMIREFENDRDFKFFQNFSETADKMQVNPEFSLSGRKNA